MSFDKKKDIIERRRQYVKKWRLDHTDLRNRSRQRNYDKCRDGFNKFKKWDQEDDILVLKHEYCDREIHRMIGRSVASIQARRSKLKSGVLPIGGIPQYLLG